MPAAPFVRFFFNRCFPGSQERVGAFFQSQVRRKADAIFTTPAGDFGEALGNILIIGLDGLGEAQITQRVFVGAINQRAVRQFGQTLEGVMHLLWRTLEQTSTACCEQRVAAEQQGRCSVFMVEGDMTERVAGNCMHHKLEAEHCQSVMVDQCDIACRNSLCRRSEYACPGRLLEFRHAADMIIVVVGDENIGQPVVRMLRQPAQHRFRVARIDHSALLARKVL